MLPQNNNEKWAWVAGASEGLGLAYAEALAARGYSVLMFARRADELEKRADHIKSKYAVNVLTSAIDLGDESLLSLLTQWRQSCPPEIGIYNAANAPLGCFLDLQHEQIESVVNINIRGALIWARVLGDHMKQRGQGAIVLMSSLAGNQGSPKLACYSASKAFNTILAESLWHEFRPYGVNVLACCAGSITTPGFLSISKKMPPGVMSAEDVADYVLKRLDRGPVVVPGWLNQLSARLVGRWLPRKWAIAIMADATSKLGSS